MYNLLPKSSWLFIFLIFNSFHSTTHLIQAGITDFSVGWKGNMAALVVLSKTIYFYILYLIPLAIRLLGKKCRSARRIEACEPGTRVEDLLVMSIGFTATIIENWPPDAPCPLPRFVLRTCTSMPTANPVFFLFFTGSQDYVI